MVADTLRPKNQIKKANQVGLLDSKLILQSFLDYLNANGPEHFPDVLALQLIIADVLLVPRKDRAAPRIDRTPQRNRAQHQPDALRYHLREVLRLAKELRIHGGRFSQRARVPVRLLPPPALTVRCLLLRPGFVVSF